LSDQEQRDEPSTFHKEGGSIIFDKPKSQEEIARERREDEQHKFAQQQVKTNQRLAWFTGLLVIGTFFGTAIGIWQARISQRAANAARDAAGVASRTLDETQRTNAAQQKFASDSLRATIENFHLDQRAWLGPKVLEMKPMQAPNPIVSAMTITNSGKTPALRVEFLFYLHPSDRPINVVEYVKHPVEKGKLITASTIMLPGATYVLSADTGATDALGVENVKNGGELIYFFAFISYLDVFGARHHTRACALYQGKAGVFGSCPGNFDHAD
jgi:hypothetical protein